MKINFLGSFKNDLANNDSFEKLRSSKLPGMLVAENPQLFQEGDSFCAAWGQFYDLEKSCRDLQIDPTDNPAKMLVNAFKSGDYKQANALYGEYTYVYRDKDTVVVGRDLTGAGLPVYYSDSFFSDSIDSFKQLSGTTPEIDMDALQAFLHLGTPMHPGTMFKGIKQLGPGEYLVYKSGNINTYAILPYDHYSNIFGSLKISEKEATEEIERLHKAAIKRRIAGKRNIALLMSGGYDSGGNVAALRNIYDGKGTGYSIGFKDDQWSELPLAKLLANTFDFDFHDYQIDGSELDDLPLIMKTLGIPFQENGLMVNYTVMRRVSKDSNDIILGGDGNDQVYGTGMQQVALHYFMTKYGMKPFQKLVSAFTRGSNSKLFSRVNFHNNRILNSTSFTSFGFDSSAIKKLLLKPAGKLQTDILKNHSLKEKSFDGLFKAHTYFKDFIHDGNNLIIYKASNMARLFGQQLSFPYMDKDSIEFVFSLPRELRFSGSVKEIAKGHGKSKFLHKRYLEPKLPREITHRKKQGGFAPLPIFFKDENRRKTVYQIIKKSEFSKELFNQKELNDFMNQYEHICNASDVWFWHQQSMAFKLFNLLTLITWLEIHVNGNQATSLNDLA